MPAVELGKKFRIPVVNFIFEAPSEEKKKHKEWIKVFNNPKTRKAWEKFRKAIADMKKQDDSSEIDQD